MYVAIDEQSRIVAAYEDSGEGLIWCEDIVSTRVLTMDGAPKYVYRDGHAYMRPTAEIMVDTPEKDMYPEMIPENVPESNAPSDAERITALEEELQAAKILLGLEA